MNRNTLDAVDSKAASRPLVSVIIPTYNYGQYIGQALESIQSQTYRKWECVVIDDGSTDDTNRVVAHYAAQDERIRYIRQKNTGRSAARNNGLRNTTGRYVQFLDADDLIEPLKIERQVEYLEQHPEVDIVYGSMRYFPTEDVSQRLYWIWGEDKPSMPEISGTGKDLLAALIRSNIMVINSPLVRRSTIEAVGLFDEILGEDWHYWIRCALLNKRFQFEDMDGTLALVRSHPTNTSKDKGQMLSHALRVREKLEKSLVDADLVRLNRQHLQLDRELLLRWLVETGVEKVRQGNTVAGVNRFWKAGLISDDPARKIKWMACAGLAPILPQQRLSELAAIFMDDSLRRIFLYKLKSLFAKLRG
jgi:glycosyltransferase involved in cell wall biosynthesis